MPDVINIAVHLDDTQNADDYDMNAVAHAVATAVGYQRPPDESTVELVVVYGRDPHPGLYPPLGG